MRRSEYLLLAVLGLAVLLLVAAFQAVPGYMDADYYYAAGLQLARGQGFQEPFLWNYLDSPTALPHASHAYWMPLASLLAALGAFLFGPDSWSAGRAGFVLVAACLPPLTAALAWSFTPRRDLAWTAGLLAVFSGFYLPFLPTSDTFGLYILFGGAFFLLMRKTGTGASLGLGLLAGLMHLARADGLLWLLLALGAVTVLSPHKPVGKPALLGRCLLVVAGYLLVMGPWIGRNMAVFGRPLAPGGMRTLFLSSYDQLFSYPADGLNFRAWWASGVRNILNARLWSLGLNLATFLSVQMEIVLVLPVAAALWFLRADRRIQLGLLAWALTFAAMTFAFPFAGARGGFFHSGAALQSLWWALTPIGLERAVGWVARRRAWQDERAPIIFRAALLVMTAGLTAAVLATRVLGWGGGAAWGAESRSYQEVGRFLDSQGIDPGQVVIVSNPPGFYLATGHPAVAVPYGGIEALLAVARDFGADCIVLEQGAVPVDLQPLFEEPGNAPGLSYLGEVGIGRIFVRQP